MLMENARKKSVLAGEAADWLGVRTVTSVRDIHFIVSSIVWTSMEAESKFEWTRRPACASYSKWPIPPVESTISWVTPTACSH